MTRGAALTGALMATLAEPATWALGLAAFLVRGGIVLLVLPVVVLPTPVGIGNVLAPTLMSVAFGQLSTELVVGAVAFGAGVVAWLCVGGWAAAVLEAEAARIVARDEDVIALTRAPAAPEPRTGQDRHLDVAVGRALLGARVVLARLVAYLPLALALAWGSVRLVGVAYRELTNPLDVATPVVIRVVRDVPEVIVLVTLAFIVGEIVGAMAARRIVLRGDGVLAALRFAVMEGIRHPLSTGTRWAVPFAMFVAVLVPSVLAATAAWRGVRASIGGPDATALFIAILVFVALWLIGLLLVAVVSAWRAAVWTVAILAAPAAAPAGSEPPAGERSSRRHRGALPPV